MGNKVVHFELQGPDPDGVAKFYGQLLGWRTESIPGEQPYIVVDTQANKPVGEIADTPGVHGFAIAADLGRGFSSNGKENKVSIVDLKTLKTIQKVDTGENPDAILYEPGRKEVYAFNGRGKSATVIDAPGSIPSSAASSGLIST